MRNLICIAKITKDLFLRLVFLDRWRVREAKIVEELTISNILRNLCSSMIIHLGKTCNKSIESENIPILVFDVHKKKQKKKEGKATHKLFALETSPITYFHAIYDSTMPETYHLLNKTINL